MKTLTCKIIELAGPNGNDGWEDVFRQAGAVGRADSEDRASFQKFKYAVGRNWDNVMSAIRMAQKQIRKMLDPSDDYNTFLREIEDLNKEYCQKDESGAPLLKDMENGSKSFTFTEEARVTRDGLVEVLKKKYADAIHEQEHQEEAVQKFMQSTVDIELFTVPFMNVPERISGPYLARMMVMCTDVPDDVMEMVNIPAQQAIENDND